ncbi:MAG: histidine kinase [Actinomycetota bacterium]
MTARRVAWAIWAVTMILLVAWLFLDLRDSAPAGVFAYAVLPPTMLAYATVGALITSRAPDNRIGLLLAWIGLALAVSLASGVYASSVFDDGVDLPAAGAAAWIGRAGFGFILAPIPLLFLLYPTGRVPGPRWRPILLVLLAALAINLTLFALTPGRIDAVFAEFDATVMNPFALPLAWRGVVEGVTGIAGLVAFACSVLAVVSLVLRFRRSQEEERQQIRWLAFVGALLVAILVLGLASWGIRTALGFEVGETDVVGNLTFFGFFLVLMFGIPAACGIAILKYRLYDLDVVVKKTVVFAVLIMLIMAVSVLIFVVVGSVLTRGARGEDTQAGGIVTLVIGMLVWPLYRLARRMADRVVYGGRASPYEVLSDFTERVGETYSTEDVLPRMAQLLGQATRARIARVWLHVGGELREAAAWPGEAHRRRALRVTGDALPDFGEEAFEVRHRGELLGALTVEMASSDPMNPSKERILRGLASEAGLVLRNVRLIEELRESRHRIVAAQDERAKKLERNIHDGAQQQLVALTVKLRLAEQLAGHDPERAQTMLAELQTQATETLEDLRDFARGIYPPLLADQGLAAALEAQARRATVPTTVEPDGIGRYPQEIESAVYFSCLEALQNVAKYAGATSTTVRLRERDGLLTFEVLDDGVGFDPIVTARGTGLQGMTDRIAAIGGDLEIRSTPAAGTVVSGRLPTSLRQEMLP